MSGPPRSLLFVSDFDRAAHQSGSENIVSIAELAASANCSRRSAGRFIQTLLTRKLIHRVETDAAGARYARGATPEQKTMTPAERDLDNFQAAERRYSLAIAPGISPGQYARVCGCRLSSAYQKIKRLRASGHVTQSGRGTQGARLWRSVS